MEVVDEVNAAESLMERLNAAAALIEQAAERLAGLEVQAGQGAREEELQQRLAEAEKTIATLKASGRKTVRDSVKVNTEFLRRTGMRVCGGLRVAKATLTAVRPTGTKGRR